MRKLLSIVVMVGTWLAAVVVAVNASQPDEKWYFGYDSSSILAFNAEGEIRPLLEYSGDIGFSSRYRLGPAAALVTLTRDNRAEGLLYLTPETAVALEGDVDLTRLESQGMDILAYQYPYLVIEPLECRFEWCQLSTSVWLANVATGQLEEIAPYVFVRSPQPLGMDDRYLRYAARTSPNTNDWALFERDLLSGDVRSFYRFNNPQPTALRVSSTGEYWFDMYPTLFSGLRPDFSWFVIRADGSVETLGTIPAGETQGFIWDMVGDTVVKQRVNCEADCWLEMWPVAGGTAQRFALPGKAHAQFVRRIDEDRVLVEQESVLWLLRASGENLRLGMTQYAPPFSLSPDGQWLFTLEALNVYPNTFSLWNLDREEVVLEAPLEDGFSLDYLEYGVFIHEFSLGMGSNVGYAKRTQDLPTVTLYRYGDGAVFTLPPYHNYLDVLADGDILVSRYQDGIYRVNPATGEEHLLLDGVEALRLMLP